MILPLLGYFAFTFSGPKLPQFYTDYYSQEDRLKAAAEILQRLIAWNELTLEKVNEIAQVVNELDPDDIAALVAKVNALEANVSALVSDLDETNADVAAINQVINSLQSSVGTLEDALVDLEARVETVEEDVEAIDLRISAVETSQGVQDSAIAANTAAISDLEGDFSTIETSVNNAVNAANAAASDANDALTEVGTYDARLTSIEGTMATLEPAVTSAVQDANDALTEVGTYDARLTAVETQSSSNATEISALDATVNSLEGTVTALTTDVSEAVSDVAAMNSVVSSIQDEVTGNSASIAGVESEVNNLNSRMNTVESSVSGLNTAVGQLTTDVTAAAAAAATAQSSASNALSTATSAQNSVDTLNGNVSNLSSRVGVNESDISTLNDSVYGLSLDVGALQQDVSNGNFRYSRGAGLMATDVDSGQGFYLPIQIPFASSNAEYKIKQTTRIDPVVDVNADLYYITDADGSNGLLYVYDTRGLTIGQSNFDNIMWTFNSQPPEGRFIPVINGTPFSDRTLGSSIVIWVRPEDSLDGTLHNIPINTFVSSFGGENISGDAYPTAQFSVSGVWMIPSKVTITKAIIADVPDGPPGEVTDFDVSGCFNSYLSFPTYGPPPTVSIVSNAAWTAFETGKTLTGLSTEVTYLIEGLRLP